MSIDSMGLDVLREIANIGSGNAANALATILDRKVDITVPRCEMIPFHKITEAFTSPEEIVTGVLVQISGDLDGFVIMILPLESAKVLVEMLCGAPVNVENGDYQSMIKEFACIEEIGNILAGSYLSAIASMTNTVIVPSVPALTIDMVMAMMNVPIVVYGDVGETALYMESEFFTDDQTKLRGLYFMVPTLDSFDRMMKMLGM